MAGSWNAIVTEINNAIAKMNQAASDANAAAADARTKADEAKRAADEAITAADDADRIAAEASEIAAMWQGATVEARTLEAGLEPEFEVKDKNGVKHLIISIPRGEPGVDGEKGEPGNSGVTFTLEDSTLYIRRDA